MERKRFRSLSSRLIPVLFLVITGQLVWWMVFFRMQDQKMATMQEELDLLHLERMDRMSLDDPDLKSTDLAIQTDTGWKIRPEVIEARESESRRKTWMLLSESIFAFAVMGAGSFYIISSFRKERNLLKEKELFL
ncbi:MAG: hypothetical protein KDK33_14920, partial [Leptospiraceae bacterium]|nr:hypothetical protein [Leptospiraceae bacterium]